MINFIILIILLNIAPHPEQAAAVAGFLAAAIVFELITEIKLLDKFISTL